VLIDKDNPYYSSAVCKAAQDDLICGVFHLSDPDIEFDNFTLDELKDIIWNIALSNGARASDKKKLYSALNGIASGEELIKRAKSTLTELANLHKSVQWGEKLIDYACRNPELTRNNQTITRPIVEAIGNAIRDFNANYLLTRQGYCVDPNTGKLIKRNQDESK
jgi:hypothetical protein